MNVTKGKFFRALVVLLAVLAVAVLLRACGILRLNFYRASFVDETEAWSWYDQESPDKLTLSGRIKDATTKTYTDTRGWQAGFNAPPDASALSDVRALLSARNEEAFRRMLDAECARRFAPATPSKVYVLRAEVSGLDSLPLLSQGHCSYAVAWNRDSDGKASILSGEVDYKVVGLLSRADLEQMMVKLIMDEAVKNVPDISR